MDSLIEEGSEWGRRDEELSTDIWAVAARKKGADRLSWSSQDRDEDAATRQTLLPIRNEFDRAIHQ
jgi:hypothetical protein